MSDKHKDFPEQVRHITSEDIVVILPEQDSFFNGCCDCGLWHKIKILQRSPELKLQFVRLDEPPDFDKIETTTVLEENGKRKVYNKD